MVGGYHLGRRGLAASGVAVLAHSFTDLGGFHHGRHLLEGGNLSSGTEVAYILICIGLVISSGLAAGLTLGLLSLDRVDLEVVKRTGTDKDRWLVARVEPLIVNPHHLLVSLLLVNAASFEALPLFLDRLLNPVAAILISVTAILIFGEILPQAVCKRYGMQVGAYLSWLVRIIMWLTIPISWPIGKVLDWMLGEETALFRRAELRAFVTLHAEPDGDDKESMLTAEEVNVIHGALDMAHKTAENAMTPLDKVFAVSVEEVVDKVLMQRIIECGHSRIPVHQAGDPKNIIGLILVKELVLADLDQGLKVRECRVREMDHLVADTPLYSVLELFRIKRRHMAAVTRPKDEFSFKGKSTHKGNAAAITDLNAVAAANGGTNAANGNGGTYLESPISTSPLAPNAAYEQGVQVIGIITIEDVIEELLQHEIVDETDVYIDNTQLEVVVPHTAASQQLPPSLMKYISVHKKLDQAKRSPSARASPNKSTGAVVAAAAGAAYAAARQNAAMQRPASAQSVSSNAAGIKPGGDSIASNLNTVDEEKKK